MAETLTLPPQAKSPEFDPMAGQMPPTTAEFQPTPEQVTLNPDQPFTQTPDLDTPFDQVPPNQETINVGPTVSDEFKDVTSRLNEETDLAKREELKAEAARAMSTTLEELEPDQVADFLTEVNDSYEGVFDGQDLTLLSASRENIVMVDTHGQLVEVPVTEENIKDVLASVKAADLEKKAGLSYALRYEIVRRSKGKLSTTEAYTYGGEGLEGSDFDEYVDDPENWVPERRELQQEIFDEELQKAHELSERLADEHPTVYVLRGNTAAGKSTAIRNNESFAKALDAKGEPSGAINPDTYKTKIKSHDADKEVQTVTHQQAHEEGSMIARKIDQSLMDSESSMVIDKRMGKKKNITDLLEAAEESDKEVKILDVDVPLELSLVRVLERPVGGDSPTVPFDAVSEGFKQIRENREALIKLANGSETIKDYILRVADDSGLSHEAARLIDGKFSIDEEDQEIVAKALDISTVDAEISRMSQTVITDDYIEGYVARVHADDPTGERAKTTRDALTRYKGKTLKEALDERARLLN